MIKIKVQLLKNMVGCGPDEDQYFKCKACGLWWEKNPKFFCPECGTCTPPFVFGVDNLKDYIPKVESSDTDNFF